MLATVNCGDFCGGSSRLVPLCRRVEEKKPTLTFGDCALLLLFAAGVHVAAASLVFISEVGAYEDHCCCVVDGVWMWRMPR